MIKRLINIALLRIQYFSVKAPLIIPGYFYRYVDQDRSFYKSALCLKLHETFEKFTLNRLTEKEFVTDVGKLGKRYASYIAETFGSSNGTNFKLIVRHKKDFVLTVQLFKLVEGDYHLPHCHSGLISSQTLCAGKLIMFEATTSPHPHSGPFIELSDAIFNKRLGSGQSFYTTANSNNCHGFYAETSSLILNVNVRGVGDSIEKSGRYYLLMTSSIIPDAFIENDISSARLAKSKAEAKEYYSKKI